MAPLTLDNAVAALSEGEIKVIMAIVVSGVKASDIDWAKVAQLHGSAGADSCKRRYRDIRKKCDDLNAANSNNAPPSTPTSKSSAKNKTSSLASGRRSATGSKNAGDEEDEEDEEATPSKKAKIA